MIREDSKIIIDWILGKSKLRVLNLHYWMVKVEDFCREFQAISFFHVFREFNLQADTLSKKGLLM